MGVKANKPWEKAKKKLAVQKKRRRIRDKDLIP